MDDILNAGLSNQNELNTNPDLDNKPEVPYSDIGKTVSANRPVDPMAAFNTSSVANPLMPTIDLNNYTRYTSSDAFPKIGINPGLSQEQLERQFDANQSYGEAFGNMVGKFWNKTSNSFTDFFRADFTTNDQLIKHMYDELKDEQVYDLYHPNFDSRSDETRKSFLQWLPGFDGSLDNYEQFLPNLGYTAGMMGAGIVQNFITGKALTGLGAIAGVAETAYEGNQLMNLITGMKNFNTGYKALKTINQGNSLIKGLQVGLEGYSMWSAFQSEAAMEGATTGQSTYEYLVDQYKQRTGLLPVGEDLEKIKTTAYNAAKEDYWMNAPILLTSNFIQFSRALMPTGAKILSEATEEAMKGYKLEGDIMKGTIEAVKEKPFAELWKEASALDRVKISAQAIGGALKPMKGTLTEGMEESLQRFSSTLSQDVAIQKHQKGKADYWDATKYSVLDMLSKEGLQEFIGGAIIGMGTSMIGKAADATGLSDKFAKATEGETKLDKSNRLAATRANLVDVLNKSGVSFMMKDSGFLDTMREVLLSKDVVNYNNENNLFEAGIAKHLGLYNGVWNAMHSGKIDFVKEQYKSFGNNADLDWLAKELKVPLEDINKDNLKQITNSVVDKIDNIKDSFKAVENYFVNSGIEKKILGQYADALKQVKKTEQDIKDKYNIPVEDTDILSHVDKMEMDDVVNYVKQIGKIQELTVLHYSFKEGVKVAAIAYQGMIDSRDKAKKLIAELNTNKAGINYTDASKFMNINTLRELKSSVKSSLDLANEPRDKKKFEKQLAIIEEAMALHKEVKKGELIQVHEEDLDQNRLAELMHEYAKSNKYEFDWMNDYMDVSAFEKTSNYLNKLKDIVRHQQRSRQNLDIYNFLYNIDNFEEYVNRNKTKIEEFIEKVASWKDDMNKPYNSSTETPEENPETPETEAKDEEEVSYDGMTVVTSDEIEKEIEKNEGKNSPYNIQIVVDENGKHHVKATFSNPIFGKGEVTGDEKTAIDTKYADLIKDLDDKAKERKIRKDTIEKVKVIAEKYDNALTALLTNTDITSEDLEELLKNLDDEMSEFLPKYAKINEIEAVREKIIDELNTLPDSEYTDAQRNNTYIPEEELKKRNEFYDLFQKIAYLSNLKTSSRDSEEDPKTKKEVLINDPYVQFERLFKLALNEISYAFYSETTPTGIYKFVITENTPELQEQAYGEFREPGQVILLKVKVGNEWKNAYVNEEQLTKGNVEISDNPANGRIMIISFNDPNGSVFQTDAAATIQDQKDIRSYQDALEFFHQQDEQNRTLRLLAKTEEIPIQIEHVSPGVIMNSSEKTDTREALKGNITDQIIIAVGVKTNGDKKLNTVFIGNQEFPVGSVVIRTKNDKYIRIYPKEINDEIIKEIDELMSYKFYYEPGQPLSDEIKAVRNYLSTLVYTSKTTREFVFNKKTRQLELVDKANNDKVYTKLSDYTKTNKVYLNVSSNQINTPTKITINEKDGKKSITQSLFSSEDYMKFVIDNSTVRGTYNENGDPVMVSSYFTFTPIVEEKQGTNLVPFELLQKQKELTDKLTSLMENRRLDPEYSQVFISYNNDLITKKEKDAALAEIDKKLGITDTLLELKKVNDLIKKYSSGEITIQNPAVTRKQEFNKVYEISDNDSIDLVDLNLVLNDYGLKNEFNFIQSLLAKNNVKVSFTGKHNGKLPKVASLDTAIVDNKLSLVLTINKKSFDKKSLAQQKEILAHEFIHGLIKLKLNEAGKLNNSEEFYTGLNNIFSDVRQLLNSTKNEDLEFLNKNFSKTALAKLKKQADYIETSIEEFATIGLTDPNFSKLLKLMKGNAEKTKTTTLWSMLSDLISKFIGIEKSKFNELLNYLTDTVDTSANYTSQYGIDLSEKGEEEVVASEEETNDIFNGLLDKFIKDQNAIYSFTKEETEIWQDPKYKDKITEAKRNNSIYDDPFDPNTDILRSKEDVDDLMNSTFEEVDNDEIQMLRKTADHASLELIFKAANSKYWGKFTTAGVILTNGAKKGTGYHEAWHVFTQMLLTKEQKRSLYKEVTLKEDKFKNHNLDNMKDVLEIEEFLANDFMNYMLTGKSELLQKAPVRKSIFKKIYDFLISLFVNRFDLEKAYNDLRIGNLYEYKASAENALFGKLNYAKGLEELSYEKLNKYSRHADAEIGRIVSQPLTEVSGPKYEGMVLTHARAISTILENPDLVKIIRDELYERFRVLGDNSTNPLVKEEIGYILTNWKNFIQYNSNYSYNSYNLVDDISEEESSENDTSSREHKFDSRADEENPTYGGKKSSKQLILLTPKCVWNNQTDSYEIVTDEDGIIEPSNFNSLFLNILNELGDTFNEAELFEKMRDKSVQRRVPEIGYIIDNLIPSEENSNKGKTDLRHDFLISFGKPIVHIRQAVRTERRVEVPGTENTELVFDYFQREQTKNNQKGIERKALTRFQGYSEETKDPFIARMIREGVIVREGNKNIITPLFSKVYIKFNFKKIEDRVNFLKLLGYEGITILPSQKKKLKEFDALTENIKKIAESLNKRVKAEKKIENPVSEIKRDDIAYDPYSSTQERIMGERDNIRKVTNFVSKYSSEDPSMSYNAPNGKLRYAPVQPNRVTTTNHFLSKTDSYEEIIDPTNTFGFDFSYLDGDKYANARGSFFMKVMFNKTANDSQTTHERVTDSNDEPVRILIDSYVGYSKENEKGATTQSFDSDELSPRDKMIVHLNTLLTSGKIPMLRAASKRTELSMSLSTYNPKSTIDSNLPISLLRVRDTKNPYQLVDFVNITNNYVEAELFKIGNKNYQAKGRDKFVLFENVFNETELANGANLEETLMKEAKEVKDGNYMKIVEKYQTEIQQAINSFLVKQKEELRKELSKYNISEKDFSYDVRKVKGLSFEKILDAFIINNYILKIEEIKLFRNDPSLYKDMFKRIGQDVSTGTLAIPSQGINNYLYQTRFFNLSTGISPVTQSINDFSKISFVTIADQIEKESPIISNVSGRNPLNVLGTNEPLPKIVSDAAYSYKLLQEAVYGDGVLDDDNSYIDNIKNEFMPVDEKGNVGGFGKINITDGGARITLDAYRRLRMATGNWSDPKLEYMYRAISLEYKLNKKLYEKESDPIAAKEKWEKEMEMYYELGEGAVFEIAKFQFNVTIVHEGTEEAILHKLSLAPIIPSAIETKEFESVHDDMLRKGIDYIPYESASKLSTVNLFNLLEQGLSNSNINNDMKISIELSSAKEQILTQDHVKEDVSAGVQMQQLNMQELLNNGVPVDFKGTVEEFEEALDINLGTIGLAYRMFNRANTRLREALRKELLNDLGVSMVNGSYKVTNGKKLVEKLHKIAESKGASINVLDYIAYDEIKKGLANPLDFSMTSDDIKKMINGFLDRKLRRMRLYGSSSIQAPDFGEKMKNHSFKNPTQEQLLEYGTNGLPFYYMKKTSEGVKMYKMGVKITFTGDYKNLLNETHLDGTKIGNHKRSDKENLNRLNECLRNKEWRERHEEALTIVGFRTPTQGKNSMDIMVIYEFLPEVTGNTIILPAGITTKSGADYDIDKMSLYFKHLDYNGKVIEVVDPLQRQVLEDQAEELKNYLTEHYDDFLEAKERKKEVNREIKVIKNEIDLLTSSIDIDFADHNEDPEKIRERANLEKDLRKLKAVQRKSNNPKVALYYKKINELRSIKKVLDDKVQAQNEMVKALEMILTSPYGFYSLTKPNSSANLESFSKEIGKRTGRENKIAKNSEMTNYLSTFKIDNALQEGKAALSAWATNTTFSQNLIAANLKRTDLFRINYQGIRTYVNDPLFSREEKERKRKNSSGLFNLSDMFMADGKTLVSSSFVEGTTMAVDVENNQYATTLGLRPWNTWEAVHLTLEGLGHEKIWAFLNQPILLELYNRLDVEGYQNRNKVIASIVLDFFPDKVPAKFKGAATSNKKARGLVNYLQHFKLNNEFKLNVLMDALGEHPYSKVPDLKSKAVSWKKLQLDVFAHFIQLNQESKLLQKLRKNTNFPSKKITGLREVQEIKLTNNFLKESAYFANVDDYFKRAISLTYDELDIFKAVYEAMFPIASYHVVSNLFLSDTNKYLDFEETNKLAPKKNVWTDAQKSKAERILTNDVMFGILQNFGFPFGNIANVIPTAEGQALFVGSGDVVLLKNEKGAHIVQSITETGYNIVSLEGKTKTVNFDQVIPLETFKLADDAAHRLKGGKKGRPIINDILKLKDKYPELEKEFPILNRFNANIDSKDSRYVNFELFRQDANEKPDKDSYITQLKKLSTHPNFEISGLFSELMLVAFYQSGYNMSPLYMTDILDTNPALSRMIKSANDTFLKLMESDYALAETFLEKLGEKIRLNNPNYYYYAKGEGDVYLEKVNFKYHRGKDYSINLNAIAMELLQKNLTGPKSEATSQNTINFTKEATDKIISGKKTMFLIKSDYKDDVYTLTEGKQQVKINFLGELVYFENEDENVYGVGIFGSRVPSNVKVINYDEEQDLSILDLESFAKANGYESFKEMREKASYLKAAAAKEKVNLYEIIPVKVNQQNATFPGTVVVNNALSIEEQLEIFEYLKPIIENSAAVTNKSVNANIMLGLGLRWDYKSNNPKLTPVPVGKTIRGYNSAYAYYDKDINGKPLEPISDRLRELMKKATGIDVSDYDGAIINIYTPNTHIGNHSDMDEAESAINYPVVAVNIGGNGNFIIGNDKSKIAPTFTAGTGYAFGINGVNRKAPHSTYASPIEGFLPALHIDHEKADIKLEKGSYRITITLRRVMPIQKGAPGLSQPSTSVKKFQGYKGGFEDKGKGTPEGDGKDKAMREVADSAIVESKGYSSSSQTTIERLGELKPESKIVMLARNGSKTKPSFYGQPLMEETKIKILQAHNQGAEFVVGDMLNVDSQFIDYLQEIGAKFTIYHTGDKSRIQVQPTVSTTTQATSESLEDVTTILQTSKSVKVAGNTIFKQNGKFSVSFKREGNVKTTLSFDTIEKAHMFASNVNTYKSYKGKLSFAQQVEKGKLFAYAKTIVNAPAKTANPEIEQKIVNTISTKENPIQIYSDGSHIKGTERLGFGSVYVYNNKEYYLTGTELSDDVANLKEKFDGIAFSNPTMEMLALAVTLESFSNTGEHIVINQDYTGAVNYDGLWQYSEGSNQRADKPWNAKEKYIKYLVARAKAAIEKIQNNGGSVKILWVKGHAGNKMNELADKYAKQRSDENTLTSPLIPADSKQNNVSLNPEISSEGEEDQDNDGINGGEEGYSPFAEGTMDTSGYVDPYEGLSTNYNLEDEDINNDTNPDDFKCH